MMLHVAGQIDEMSNRTWQIIEQALGCKRPPRNAKWLADKLDVSAQVMTNWKTRRVPAGRLRAIAEALGLSLDQLEGLAPLPWESATSWPFPNISRDRFYQLDETQRTLIEGAVLKMLMDMEDAQGASGKSSRSGPGTGRRKAA